MAENSNKKSFFQYGVMGAFALFIVIAMIMFASTGGGGAGGGPSGAVVIWGTIDETILNVPIATLEDTYKGISIEYVQKSEATFDDELLNALAEGTGPDLFFLPDDKILKNKNKIFIIPYENYALKTFQSQFIDEAALYLAPEGVIAFPFMIDPLVMYYNRDMLSSSFIVEPPKFWDEFLTFAPKVSQQTESGEIVQSAVALGAFDNVNNAKDIFSLLVMQLGNPIVGRNTRGELVSLLRNTAADNSFPAESALRFYTNFSNPAQDSYSWNGSLRNSRDAFLAGDLAIYFGYASEIQDLRQLNPNLNFDVTLVPQMRDARLKATFGKMFGIAVSRSAPNLASAFTVAGLLTSPPYIQNISETLLLPPVRKELLQTRPNDPFLSLFYDSAIISRGWLDPDPAITDAAFRRMINSTISGSLRTVDAIDQVNVTINNLLQ